MEKVITSRAFSPAWVLLIAGSGCICGLLGSAYMHGSDLAQRRSLARAGIVVSVRKSEADGALPSEKPIVSPKDKSVVRLPLRLSYSVASDAVSGRPVASSVKADDPVIAAPVESSLPSAPGGALVFKTYALKPLSGNTSTSGAVPQSK